MISRHHDIRHLREADGFILHQLHGWVDNRDGFWTSKEVPAEALQIFDSRTHLVMSRSLFWKLIAMLEA
jgi:hypothetical protein